MYAGNGKTNGAASPESRAAANVVSKTAQSLPVTQPVIQMTKWKWNGKTWDAISEVTSRPPALTGLYVGQILDDKEAPPERTEFGAGNFSFASSYVKKHPSFAPSFTPTTIETRDELMETYPKQKSFIKENLDVVKKFGATPEHGVDATTHKEKDEVQHFNFPHTGDIHTKKTSIMLKEFLATAEASQDEGHIIRMGLLEEGFDSRYGLRGALKKSSYHPVRKMKFNEERFEDYRHVKTTGKGDFDFSGTERTELWLQKTGDKGNKMDDIPDLQMEEGYNSDEERMMVYDSRKEKREKAGEFDLRRYLEEKPVINMTPITLTDQPSTGAYRTFKGAKVIPTGRFDGVHIEIEVLDSTDKDLPKGTKAFAKRKHLEKVGDKS